MATFKLSPMPRIPSPGARDFEAQIGNVLSHLPTLAAEIKDMAEATVEAAVLVDAEGNATIAATGASQAALSATSAVNASTKAAESLAAIKAEATKATKAKSAAELAASQAGINALAASDNAVRAETAALQAEAIAATKAEEVAVQAAADAATQAVSGVIAQAQASAEAAATSAADANTAKNAAQAAATTAGQNVTAIATHAQTAQTASTAASNHAHNAGLRAAESLASAQQATSAGQAATAGAAQVLEILDNLNTGPVVSVNGKFGAVNLVPSDVGAEPAVPKATGYARWNGVAWEFVNEAYQTAAQVESRVQQIVGAAPAALDTLAEIAQRLADEADISAALMQSVSERLPLAGGTMSGAINFAPAQTWPTFNQSTTGNAATATKLAAARSIDLTGAVTGKASFDGTQDVSIVTTIPTASAVSYTYDASGRVSTTTEALPTGTRTTTVTYNEAGQVKTVTVTLGTSTRTTQYAYDQYGVLTGTTSTES